MTKTSQLLRELVALPSINPMGRSLAGPEIYEHQVTAYLEDYFRGLGVSCERQTVAPLRDNLLARLEVPGNRPTLLLEVHQDTVPADNMVIDPFAGRVENGRLYGRGACDVKGGMAAMLAMAARLVREKPAAACNLILAFTVDEEHTFLGVQHLMRAGLRADMAVVAEPTQLQIVNAHKGVARWFVTSHGRSCHSSTPEQGVNAIYRMAGLLVAIEPFAELLRTSRVDLLLGPATLSVGRIEGGTSANVVPDRCRIEIDRRILPGEDPLSAPAELEAYLKAALGSDYLLESSAPWLNAPALSPAGSEDLVRRLGHAIERVRGAHAVRAVPYGTDASTIAAAGVPAVVFGPGDIAQAHTCDEWIALEQVDQASEILYWLACAS